MISVNLLVAYLLDLIWGDPPKIPHPVILIGKLINCLEQLFYKKERSNRYNLISGAFLVIIVISTAYLLTWLIIIILKNINPILGLIINIWLISTTLAIKGLYQAGVKIRSLLDTHKIAQARKEVGYIVGRDTHDLDETELIRATVETIAENIVDAITSPLFYAFLGGAPLAMAYRAINTLDSMLGYRNEKYLYFGKIAARVDDVFNYLPARITGVSIALVAFVLPGCLGSNSLRVLIRDARNHPSPNSGFSESAVSGALGIRLGGLNYYQGRPSQKPYIGYPIYPLTPNTIIKTNHLMVVTATVWIVILTLMENLF